MHGIIDLEIYDKCEVLKMFFVHVKEKQLTRFGTGFLEKALLLAEVFPLSAKVMSKWIWCWDANFGYMHSLV